MLPMERSSTSRNYSIDRDIIYLEELIAVTHQNVVDLENLRSEYKGFMPDMIREEYNELKNRLQRLREVHYQLVSSSNVSRDSNGVSPRRALIEVTEISSNHNADSLTNLKTIDNYSHGPIISNPAYKRTSYSLDHVNNNGWLDYKDSSMKECPENLRQYSQHTNEDARVKFGSMNLFTREFVIIHIPPELTFKLRVTIHEDLRSVVEPYFKNSNIKSDDVVVVDIQAKKIINLDIPSIEYSKKISKKFFVATKNCVICKSLIINGLKCSQCFLTFHKKCYCKNPTLCDPNVVVHKEMKSQLNENELNNVNNVNKSTDSKMNLIRSQIVYPNLYNFPQSYSDQPTLTARSAIIHKPPTPPLNCSLDEMNSKHNKSFPISNYCTLNKNNRGVKMSGRNLNNKRKQRPKFTSDNSASLSNNQKFYNNVKSCNHINYIKDNYPLTNNNNNQMCTDSDKCSFPCLHKTEHYSESDLFEENNLNSLDHDNISQPQDNKSLSYETKNKRRRIARVKPVTENLQLPWVIENGDVRIREKIGVGSFGTVYKGSWHGDIAVKVLNVASPSEEQLDNFKNEVNILRKTRHNNIVLFVGCIYSPVLAIVAQWCDGLSLYNFIHVDEHSFKMAQLVSVAIQTCDGMDYLHAKNIIHRDLKTNNLFIQNSVIKIGDFGLSTVKRKGFSETFNKQPTGSILWMAPEVIRMDTPDPYTPFSDVYSFGIVLFELLSCKLPYSHIKSKDQILYMVGKGKLQPDISLINKKYGTYLKTLYLNCINFTASERPLFPNIAVNLTAYNEKLPRISRTTSTKELRSSLGSNVYSFDEDFM